MPETTVRGVSLYSEGRSKSSDVFELSLTYQGIEIRRPGEETRHLAWDRITEWEIEQRRGGVLLILRGSGSVTPLVIPKWRVDDLDVILHDVTTGPAQTVSESEVEVEADHVVEAEFADEPEDAADVRAEVEAETEVVVEVEVEVVMAEVVEVEEADEAAAAIAAEFDAEPQTSPVQDPSTTFEDVVTKAFTPERDPDFEVVLDAGKASEETDVDGTLVWPSGAPLESLSDLVWPREREADEPIAPTRAESTKDIGESAPVDESVDLVWPDEDVAGEVDSEFMANRPSTPAPPPAVREAPEKTPTIASTAAWTIEEIPDMAPAIPEAFPTVAPPDPKTTATPPARAARPPAAARRTAPVPRAPQGEKTLQTPAPASAPAPAPKPRARQRRRERRWITLSSVASVVLLGVLAVAVALVLAQSAGLVHLGFLGGTG